ncbi:hypothetical protein IGI04_023470 [Brassica rapa subsp. trilocularis]|uniref:Uncharacterized protein n=1 Tax=Brassica rapa subsp. trilocularis TaxID=1813537 RepID=A0ABQ7M4J7_BRACM|nr:hypothetical protein IGI04_023470 [Brassica rapa subsp. trilocularis]
MTCSIRLARSVSWTGRVGQCVRSNSSLRRRKDYELSSRNLTLDARILVKRQILGSFIRVFDTMPRDVRDQCDGFRARPRSTHGFRGALTTSTCVSRIVST